MPKNIAKLRKREKAAFIRRQKAWVAYSNECGHTIEAYSESDKTWEDVLPAMKAMNEAFDALVDQLGRKPLHSEYSPEYLAARQEFLVKRAVHHKAKANCEIHRKKRNCCKASYDAACVEHERAKNELMEALSEKPKFDDNTVIREIDMTQVESKPFYLKNLFGKNAVVVKRRDDSGKIDIYFDGIADDGGGIGHGHAVIDATGKVVYLRDSWCDHDDSIINDYHADNHRTSPVP